MNIPYGHLELFVIVAIVIVIGFLLFVPIQQPDLSRKVSTSPRFTARPRSGGIAPIRNTPLTFSGHGDYVSTELALDEGLYALEYQFPENQLGSVRLLDTHSDTEQVMFMKSGSGKLSVSLEDNGPYILQVRLAEPKANWRIEFRHIV